MNELDREPSEDLAEWLTAVGRRTWISSRPAGIRTGGAKESSEELIGYLEELSGRKFRSREDVKRYVDALTAKSRDASLAHWRSQVIKDTVLLLCLLTAYIQYSFLDINLQISRMPSTLIFVPADIGNPSQRNANHA